MSPRRVPAHKPHSTAPCALLVARALTAMPNAQPPNEIPDPSLSAANCKKMMIASVLAMGAITVVTGQQAPTGLLADFQKSPALGVRAVPRFT